MSKNTLGPNPTPGEIDRLDARRSRRKVVGTFLGALATVGGAIGLAKIGMSGGPESPDRIVTLVPNGVSDVSKYKVVIGEGGDINHVVQAFAKAEGDKVNPSNEGSPVSQGIDHDSKVISRAVNDQNPNGSGTMPGTSFEVSPDAAIKDPSTLNDVTGVTITKEK